MSRPFLKMNGLGNDFVVVEARNQPFEPSAPEVRAIADRAKGVGCDQLIAIEPPDPKENGGVDARVRFWNSDGEEVSACGNGTRCVGWLLMQSTGKDAAVIETKAGKLFASVYALFSGTVFLVVVGVVFAPVVHRALHRFHMETEEDEEKKEASGDDKG